MRENREMENGNIPFVDIEKEASKEIDSNSTEKNEVPKKSLGRQKLESWLNYTLKIQMTDGRTLIGVFLCTDQDNNIILGSCNEYLSYKDGQTDEEPRVLGLAMVPGRHVVSICLDSMLMASQNSAYVT